MSNQRQRITILSVQIDAVTLTSARERIEGWISKRARAYVCVAPVSTIMDCQDDPAYRDIVNRADMVTPDGMPVVWLGRWTGNKTIQRTYGPDLMRDVCQAGVGKNFRHYLYGSTPQVLDLLESRLKKQFPGINIVGSFSPPFFRTIQRENEVILENIRRAKPDILWVGLGSPKQDYWMAMHRPLLEVPVMIGVGAAFDFFAGTKRQAPGWMQRSGLEWSFRLLSEPRRLWKRYLVGNSRFVLLIARDRFKRNHQSN